jgi:hypothetical protein
VIQGKPVMRNLKSDVTRFVPTHLKVRRGPEVVKGVGAKVMGGGKKREEGDEKKMSMFTQQQECIQFNHNFLLFLKNNIYFYLYFILHMVLPKDIL